MAPGIEALKLNSRIHESGKSIVYRGDLGGRCVIVKRLKLEACTAASLARFRLEFDILRELDAEHFPKAIAYFELEGTPLQVYEDIGAISLAAILSKSRLPLRRALEIARAAARGLRDAHGRGITHKDINPNNIVANLATGQVQVIDFGIATRMSREAASFAGARGFEGTIDYLSPEQTGRMNRTVDYRTDLFSLGVTLYELTTGNRPFAGEDASEIVHQVLAKAPAAPHITSPDVPWPLSQVIMRLLEKAPESRYQSTQGLIWDLDHLYGHLFEGLPAAAFVPGSRDASPRFLIPEALFGREAEAEALGEALARVGRGGNELIEVSGPSGSGKSALVAEAGRRLGNSGGLFIEGKFDQFRRQLPMLAISQALEHLIEQLLKGDQRDVDAWRADLLAALGGQARALFEIVPSLEKLLGAQPPVLPIDPERARMRTMQLLDSLLRCATTRARPVVMFLDDLQWADIASLDVIRRLLGPSGPPGLAMIVTYRSDEVGEAHPTRLALKSLGENGTSPTRIGVGALQPDAIERLVAVTLRTDVRAVERLAATITTKTLGNAFYVRALLQHLFDAKLITFDPERAEWTWDESGIDACVITDNVAEFLVRKLGHLPRKTSEALTLAACIGERFDLDRLALLLHMDPVDAAAVLEPAVQEGVIVPLTQEFALLIANRETARGPLDEVADQSFRFSHDRLQQAAHMLLPPDVRSQTHYKIGWTLLSSQARRRVGDIFSIVGHLNEGLSLAIDPDERRMVAELNVKAGLQAQAAAAYDAAIDFFTVALRMTGDPGAETHYELYSKAQLGLARSFLALNRYEDGVACLNALLTHLTRPEERADVYDLLAAFHETRTDYESCISVCLAGIHELGIHLSGDISNARLVGSLAAFKCLWKSRTLEHLEAGGAMSERWTKIIALYCRMATSCFFVRQNLFVYGLVKLAVTAQRRREPIHNPTFAIGLAMILLSIRDKVGARAARAVAQRQIDKEHPETPLYYVALGHFVDVMQDTYRSCSEKNEFGFLKGMQEGDLPFAGVNAFLMILNAVLGGFRLAELTAMADRLQGFFKATNPSNAFTSCFLSVSQVARNFAGLTKDRATMSDATTDETAVLERAQASLGNLSIYRTMRAWIDFDNEAYDRVIRAGIRNFPQKVLPGCFTAGLNGVLVCLSMIAVQRTGRAAFRFKWLDGLIVRLYLLELLWWDSFDYVGSGLRDLVAAHRHWARGRRDAALRHFAGALRRLGRAQSYYWIAYTHAALGEFYLEAGLDVSAAAHMREAIERYRIYGHEKHAERLDARHRSLLDLHLSAGTDATRGHAVTRSSTSMESADIDVEVIVKASQSIASQIEVERLVVSLLRAAMEHGGATHGTLLTIEAGAPVVKVVGEMRGDGFYGEYLDETATAAATRLAAFVSERAVHYVVRTGEELIIDAAPDSDFAADPFLNAVGSRSVLCAPVLLRGELVAVIFLENRLATSAFTGGHLKTLRLLTAQGAISLAHARFVRDLRESSEKIGRLKGRLEKILVGTKAMASDRSAISAVSVGLRLMVAEIPALRGARCGGVFPDAGRQLDVYREISLGEAEGEVGTAEFPWASSPWRPHLAAPQDGGGPTPGTEDLVVPIRWQGTALCLLVFARRTVNALSEEESGFIETLARSLGLALMNIEHAENLEALVAKRTEEIKERQRKLQTIFDCIDQGILTFDETLVVDSEFSAFVTTILELPAAAVGRANALKLIFSRSHLSADAIQRANNVLAGAIGESEMTWRLNRRSVPNEIYLSVGGVTKTVALDWKPLVEDGVVTRMMLTMRDLTRQRVLEQSLILERERNERVFHGVLTLLGVERDLLNEFFLNGSQVEESLERLQTIRVGAHGRATLARTLHTLKGTARSFGFQEIADAIHLIESELAVAEAAGAAARANLGRALKFYADLYQRLFHSGAAPVVAGTWSLHTLAGGITEIGTKMLAGSGFRLKSLEIMDRVIQWPKEWRARLPMIVAHCITNSLDHGYLLARRRGIAVADPEIAVAARRIPGGGVEITIQDRGAGIDLEALARIARERHLTGVTDLSQILFLDGVSTASSVSGTSGRGVGLAAVRQMVRQLGGDLAIANTSNGGACLTISLPDDGETELAPESRSKAG